jgi:DNA-binding transcriptional LysR family regulator
LQQLEQAEESARQSVSALQGTVVIGVMPSVAQEVLCDALPQFHALHPGIRVDLRFFMRPTKEQIEGVDVTLSVGWPNDDGGLVSRSLGAVGLLVCASPEYLRSHAPVRHPSDLARHSCLVLRTRHGTLMNLWRFRRGDEQVDVPVQGWICSDNGHRDTLLRLATAGHGFVRLLDWRTRPDCELATGKVLPVLTDWESVDVPGVYLHYPPTVRKVPRVRAFIDFAEKLFGDLQGGPSRSLAPSGRPSWLASRHRKVAWTAPLRP